MACRQEQSELVADAINHGLTKHITGYNAETGIGKTLAYAYAAMMSDCPAVICVPTHQLGDQVNKTFALLRSVFAKAGLPIKRVEVRHGKQEYISPYRVSALEDSVEAEDQDLYLSLVEASLSDNCDNLISSFLSEFDRLPSGVTPSMIVCGSSHADSAFLAQARESQSEADILIISQALLLVPGGIDSLPTQFKRNSLLIVDEADSLVALASMIFSQRIALSTIELALHSLKPREKSRISTQLEGLAERSSNGLTFLRSNQDIFSALETLEILLRNSKEDRIMDIGDRLNRFTMQGLQMSAISKEESSGKSALIQLSTFASIVCGKYFNQFDHVMLFSGTLDITAAKETEMPWLSFRLGIHGCPSFYGHYSPSRYGKCDYILASNEWPSPILEGELNPEFISACSASIVSNQSGHSLVCTASFDETRAIGNALSETKNLPFQVIIDKPGSRLSKTIDEFREAKGRAVLLTPRASIGTDIRTSSGGQLFKTQFITRIPFVPPLSEGELEWIASEKALEVERIQRYHYQDGLQKAVRRLAQTLGRMIRSDSDEGVIFILDRRFPSYSSSNHAIIKNVIPSRFKNAYRRAKTILPSGEVERPKELIL